MRSIPERKRTDVVISSYSRHAREFEQEKSLNSCWGFVTDLAYSKIKLQDRYRLVVEVGCGTGHELQKVGSQAGSNVRLIGVEPAEELRGRAVKLLNDFKNVRVLNGRFEDLPIESGTVDYIYSILAFHWTTSLETSVRELSRVLKPDGCMDLFFTGRNTGREFKAKTTPIFLKYMGPGFLLASAALRQHLTCSATAELFGGVFPKNRLRVRESFHTCYDDIQGHWSWWRSRAAPHFVDIPEHKRGECDAKVRQAIESLAIDQGIPYTVHLIHVEVRS